MLEWHRLYALGAQTTIECRVADTRSPYGGDKRRHEGRRTVLRVRRRLARPQAVAPHLRTTRSSIG